MAYPKQVVRLRRVAKFLRQSRWILLDILVVAFSYFVAVVLRFVDTPQGFPQAIDQLSRWVIPVGTLYAAMNHLFGLQRRAWRYAGAPEVLAIAVPVAISTGMATTIDILLGVGKQRPLPLGVVLLGGFLAFSGFVGVRYRRRLLTGVGGIRLARREPPVPRVRTLIYGAGELGQVLVGRLLGQKEGRTYHMVGFIDDDRAKKGQLVHGIKVLGNRFDLPRLVERRGVDLIILAIANLAGDRRRAILSAALETSAQIRMAPNVFEWMQRPNGAPLFREVQVQDLLGRPPVTINVGACMSVLGEKVSLITGACGSIGQELCRQLASFSPRLLVMVDNNETGLYDLDIELRTRFPRLNCRAVVADVTDERKMDTIFREAKPHVVFHAAAYKHVPLMEEYPDEAVRVNIGGTRITIAKALEHGAGRFVLVSTDKAVNPTSVMGASKRIAEMLAMSVVTNQTGWAANNRSPSEMLCTAVRFGNVLGSRGSVVPTFARQIELGGPVTVTHPDMTRYFMDVSEAAKLIIQAAALTAGGDIFTLDMGDRIRIDDLARKMIRLRGLRPELDIPIRYTGVRPGEKLHEELAYAEEERQPTTHPSIHRSVHRNHNGEAPLNESQLLTGVENLMSMVAHGNRDKLVVELIRMTRGAVPEGVVAAVPVPSGH